MRKARKKAVSIIVALTFLLGLVFAYAGPAAADTTYVNFSGAYSFVTSTGDNKSVSGYVYITEKQAGAVGATTYVTLTLPEGVQYMAAPTGTASYVYQGDGSTAPNATFLGGTTKEINLEWTNAAGGLKFVFNATDKSALKIDSSVSGDIKATVRVWKVVSNAIVWDETTTVTIAKVVSANVTVTAEAAKTVTVGTGKPAAQITIQESVPGAIPSGKNVYVTLLTSGAKFSVTGSTYDAVGINGGVQAGPLTPSSDGTKLTIPVTLSSSGIAGKIVVKPQIDVPPTVTGDITVKVSGDDGSKIPETTLIIAKVGQGSYTVEASETKDQVVYQGQSKDLTTDITLKPQSGGVLPQGSYVTLELPAGAKWNFSWATDTAPDSSVTNFVYKGVYNDGRTMWFSVGTGGVASNVKISDLKVKVAPTFAPGDLTVTVGGNAGVSGSVVIAQVKAPFTVTAAEKPEIKLIAEKQAAGKIVIKETAAGALKAGSTITLRVPYGVAFSATPTVKVTDGNLSLGSPAVQLSDDNRTATITLGGTASSVASTLEVSDIKYDTDNRAAYGDVLVTIGGTINEYNSDPLAKVANATIPAPAPPVSPTKREASFVIGSTTYKVNGKDSTMDVAPYIDAASGRTFLPVRYVAYALGVSEDNIFYSNGVVSLLKDGRAVQMTIGSKALVVNGVTITMDAAPVIKDGRTMLPFRWIATALGASVKWDEATKTVTMTIE